jgi:segregation and condensation protein A
VLFIFLALLEMLALQLLTIQVGEGYNNFWISKSETTATASTQNEAIL